MKKKYSLLIAMLLVFTMLLAACGGTDTATTDAAGTTEAAGTDAATTEATGGEETEAGETEAAAGNNPASARENAADTLVMGISATSGVYNPVYYETAYDGYVVDLVFAGLLTNNEDGEYLPGLAESWEISEDQKTITVKIKENANFSDGEPVKASDVVHTYKIMADPSYQGRMGYVVDMLEGGDEYRSAVEGGQTDAEYAGVVAVDDKTVEFNFKEANVTNLGEIGFGVLPAHYYEYTPGDTSAITAKHGAPMGAGPYKFVNEAADEYVELERNEDFWMGTPNIPKLLLRFVAKETELQEFANGGYDALDTVENTPENLEVINGMSDFATLLRYDNNGYAYIGLNMDNPSLAKKEVRQALAYGFDRYAFVEDFFDGAAVVPNVPFARVNWAYSDELAANINQYEYDPDKAIELLEAAGYTDDGSGVRTDGTNKLSFRFETYSDTAWTETLVSILKDEWSQIGVEIIENFQEFAGFSDKIFNQRDFDMYTMAWSLVIDPSPRGIFHSDNIGGDGVSGNNAVGWRNEKSDELLVAGEMTFDQAERQAIYEEWGTLWNDELPYIPIYMRENWVLINNRVQGMDVSPFMGWTKPEILLNLELVD